MFNDLTLLVGNLGFPIAVTVFLLYREHRLTERLQTTLDNNSKAIALIVEAVKNCNESQWRQKH